MAQTHQVGGSDGVQVGGPVVAVLQSGQGRAEFVVNSLSAVVVPLHVQQVGDRVDGCWDTKKSSEQVLTAGCTEENSLRLKWDKQGKKRRL